MKLSSAVSAFSFLGCTCNEPNQFRHIRGAPASNGVPAFLGGKAFDSDGSTIGIFGCEGIVAAHDVMDGLWCGSAFADAVQDRVEGANALAQRLVEQDGDASPLRGACAGAAEDNGEVFALAG